MEEGSVAGLTGTTRGPGGGWRALLADVRGERDPLLAALDGEVREPVASLVGRWCPSALDDLWRSVPPLGRMVTGPFRRVS